MMFGMFRKKSDLENLIKKDGLENVTTGFAHVISQKLHNRKIAYQFVLEEIEAASMGNTQARSYACNSGIPSSEYMGSLANSLPEVDGPGGPQQTLLVLCMQLQANQNLMAQFRIGVLDKIMRQYEFGIYTRKSDDNDKVFKPIANTRLSHITTHILNFSMSNLNLVSMEIKEKQCEELVLSCADQIPSDTFDGFDTKVVAMMIMLIVAENGVDHHEEKTACMLAMSVIWAAKKIEKEGCNLTEKERALVIQLEIEARKLLEKHYQTVNEMPARLWIAATLSEPTEPK